MIVLDASALVDAVLDQRTAPWVLAQLAGGQVCAPAHQMAEVLSAVARLQRAGEIEPLVARAALAEAAALDQEVVPTTRAHLFRALELNDHVRALDGLYLALAEERRCPLVTTDRRLAAVPTTTEIRVPTL
jgi:predicted nucleic acid-binding protein